MTSPGGRSSSCRRGRSAYENRRIWRNLQPHPQGTSDGGAAADALGLEKVLLIPDNLPPHKALPAGSATGEDRLEMCRLTAGEVPGMEVLDLELRRSGPSYTSDTLAELHAQYPDDELWLLVGSDMFLSLQEWHEPERILSLAGIAAFHRTRGDETGASRSRRRILSRSTARASRCWKIQTLWRYPRRSCACSSRRAGRSFLTEAVCGYVLRRGLYGTHADLSTSRPRSSPDRAELSQAQAHAPCTRHGARGGGARAALRRGRDERAHRGAAARLHEEVSMEEQLALCEQYGIALDELERKNLKLLHAKTGRPSRATSSV